MSSRITPQTNLSQGSALQQPILEVLKAFVRHELEEQLGDFLNIIDDRLDRQTTELRNLIQLVFDDSDNKWRNHKGPISKGKDSNTHLKPSLTFVSHEALLSHELSSTAPPTAQEKKKDFLAEVGDFKSTGGTQYERKRREWTKCLYLSSFQPLSLVNFKPS